MGKDEYFWIAYFVEVEWTLNSTYFIKIESSILRVGELAPQFLQNKGLGNSSEKVEISSAEIGKRSVIDKKMYHFDKSIQG